MQVERSVIEIARHWVEMLASGDFSDWPALASGDLLMRAPFSPPGLFPENRGSAHCLDLVKKFYSAMHSFAWYDIEAWQTDDPELVFGQAKSRAITVAGAPYNNQYCYIVRIRGGKVIEYSEYFNPLPVIEVFSAYLKA